MDDEQLEILTEIFRTLFNNSELNLDDKLVARDVPGWDSFNHINLIINIEEGFGVRFTNAEVGNMQNVGDLKKILAIKISS